MIEIFRGSIVEATNIKNLLEVKGIEVFVANALMSSIEPWTACPTIIKVEAEAVEKASKIISDYEIGKFTL